MTFSSAFLEALGQWQRGWGQDPNRRAPIAAALEREAGRLPARFRQPRGLLVFRKRHLYRSEDQRELFPLFMLGSLDEGGPTSWSRDLGFAKKYDNVVDDNEPKFAAGAIFAHMPRAGEIVLDIPALWDDPAFIAAAQAYRDRGGAQAEALFHFRGERDQNEIVLRAPLRLDELYVFGGRGSFDGMAEEIGATTPDLRDALQAALDTADLDPLVPRFLSVEGTALVKDRVVSKMRARMQAWIAPRTPHRPDGRSASLGKAVLLAEQHGARRAGFEGWRRLSGPDGLMEARWKDGSVAWRRRDGAIWIW